MNKLNNEKIKNNIFKLTTDFKGIPARFIGLTFEDFGIECEEQQKILRFCEEYVSRFDSITYKGQTIVFSGGVGTGKTMLAMLMKQALMKMGYAAHYESVSFFIDKIDKRAWHLKYTIHNIIDEYSNYPLLIIDDLTCGTGLVKSLSDRDRFFLSAIIEQRYQNNLSTILITNHDEEKLKEVLGDEMIKRLNEFGLTLTFNWDSYRQKKGNDTCWYE